MTIKIIDLAIRIDGNLIQADAKLYLITIFSNIYWIDSYRHRVAQGWHLKGTELPNF